ncbi:glycoside hydrolase family 28 protein [Salipaludibacillus sp. HK11]|uniref:glycoside hydrolase family 28 protein n=1 Tax=Salipaludibacillus sp. HK11 TaxID=3394320 RepID=UPI0039FD8064
MKISITDFGAIGDGITLNTEAIKKAITACELGNGGTVVVPSGRYVTGPIQLVSNMTFEVQAGAVILFTDDFQAYPPVKTRWSGYECFAFTPLLFGNNLENVTICGQGTFDGQGQAWWKIANKLKEGKSFANDRTMEIRKANEEMLPGIETNILEWETQFLRPPLCQLIDCQQVTIEGVTLQNSPFWNTHLVYCDHVSVRGVTINNPADSPNGDGLDIDSSRNVRIIDCHFDVGDDCLCLKSGINEDGRRVAIPTENIVVTNCTMARGHGGIVFGSESSGGIKNVTVSNCVFIGTDRGIRFKTNRARGSYIKSIMISNIYMENVFCPIAINSFYRYGVDENDPSMNVLEAIDVTEKTPIIKDIHISHIIAKNVRAAAAFIYGLPEMPIQRLNLSHLSIEMTKDPNEQGGEPDMVKETILRAGDGMFIRFVDDLIMTDVTVETRQGPALTIKNGKELELHQVRMKERHANTPVVELENSQGVFLEGAQFFREKETFVKMDEKMMSQLITPYL